MHRKLNPGGRPQRHLPSPYGMRTYVGSLYVEPIGPPVVIGSGTCFHLCGYLICCACFSLPFSVVRSLTHCYYSSSSMRRLEANESWSLFDPADVRGLTDKIGDHFVTFYEAYERDGLAVAKIPARTLWDVISGSLRESGTPFLMYSDNVNGTYPVYCTSHYLKQSSRSAQQPYAPRRHQIVEPVHGNRPVHVVRRDGCLYPIRVVFASVRSGQQDVRLQRAPPRYEDRCPQLGQGSRQRDFPYH